MFFLFDFLILSGNFVTATVHFVLLLLVLRLYSAKRNRDFVFLAVLAFLMILAAAVLTVNSTVSVSLRCLHVGRGNNVHPARNEALFGNGHYPWSRAECFCTAPNGCIPVLYQPRY
jgi:hypothetical protein